MADRRRYAPLRALVGLEMRRALPLVGRGLILGGTIVAVLIVTGAFTVLRMAWVIAVVGIAPVTAIPIAVVRDKIEGGLEFLRFLPAPPATHALARLISLALIAVPASLAGTVAAVLSMTDAVAGMPGVRPLAGIFLALMLTFVVGGFLATAFALRFDVTQAGYAPLGILALFLLLDRVEERYFPDPLGTFTGLMAHGWFLPALGITGVAAAAAVTWFAFSMACRGIERFSPPRDRITW